MIKLKTSCKDCVHKDVCRNVNNAENARNKLASTTYGNGTNDDYSWAYIMDHQDVNITFSCSNFMEKIKSRGGDGHFNAC